MYWVSRVVGAAPPAGEHLADFAGDQVQVEVLHAAQADQHWPEWENELVDGAGRFFTAAASTMDSKPRSRTRPAAHTTPAPGP